MPSYSVPRADIHDKLADLEHEGERVVTVQPDGDGAWLVVTYKTRGKTETR